MGRPRKRRREDEANEYAELPGESNSHAILLNDPWANSSFAQFGTITPPQGPDSNVSSHVVEDESGTLSQHNFDVQDPFGVSPTSNLE